MKEKVKLVFSDKTSRIMLVITLVIILLQIAVLFLIMPNLPPEVPLFYSLNWGISQLTASYFLFLLPVFSFLFMFINLILSSLIIKEDNYLARIILVPSIIIAGLFGITLINIIKLVS